MKFLNYLHDKRVDCYSLLVEMNAKDFLALTDYAYENNGNIDGQREALKTKTAKTIRERMVKDVKEGAVLPSIVLGIYLKNDDNNKENFLKLIKDDDINDEFVNFIQNFDKEQILIIDGMQRTTALKEILLNNIELQEQTLLRIEFWIATQLNSLIYRMLVLNTGQIPWGLERQLESIYRPIINNIKEMVDNSGIEAEILFDKNNNLKNDKYKASFITELYLVFSSRNSDVIDLKDKIAEDFARLEVIESNSKKDFTRYFIRCLDIQLKFKKIFGKSSVAENTELRFKSGSEIFNSKTVLIGFFSAISKKILGEFQLADDETIAERMSKFENQINEFINRLEQKNTSELDTFLALDALNERVNQRVGQAGRFERELFDKAFSILFERMDDIINVDNGLYHIWK